MPFEVEVYFEAYVKYIEDCRQARTEGHDPKSVEFHPPDAIEGGVDDEESMPLDGEASSPNLGGDGAGVAEGRDRDEDPDI